MSRGLVLEGTRENTERRAFLAREDTRTTEQQVRAYLAGHLDVGRLVVAILTSGASQAAVLNGPHADQLADQMANYLKTCAQEEALWNA